MKKAWIWSLWLVATLGLAGYYGYHMFAGNDHSDFLIGKATSGHHQIELACGSCHTSAFGGGEVLQDACVKCHGDELKAANDSHPKSKFTDPRNADRLAHLDARFCVTCHREHHQEQADVMGVTLAGDFCFRCHQNVAEDLPDHKGMAFNTCASAGCHNYHDNRALYEDYLVKHGHESVLRSIAKVALRTPVAAAAMPADARPLQVADMDAPATARQASVTRDWLETAHAQAGVNCSGCHQNQQTAQQWTDKPPMAVCQSCHAQEAMGFFQGKHGMRLAPDLSVKLTPMTPAQGRLPFKPDAAHRELTCTSCHGAHRFDVQQAAVESCLGCHADDHSRAFKASPHARLWQAELDGKAAAGTGVSCATCHLPRETHDIDGKQQVLAQHNQNANLRPNEKMIRSVCESCHGLGFAIDALADPLLLQNNFSGQPSRHIESIDMALRKDQEKAKAGARQGQPEPSGTMQD